MFHLKIIILITSNEEHRSARASAGQDDRRGSGDGAGGVASAAAVAGAGAAAAGAGAVAYSRLSTREESEVLGAVDGSQSDSYDLGSGR